MTFINRGYLQPTQTTQPRKIKSYQERKEHQVISAGILTIQQEREPTASMPSCQYSTKNHAHIFDARDFG